MCIKCEDCGGYDYVDCKDFCCECGKRNDKCECDRPTNE